MTKKILVVAPHPDDETLGCGGSILRHKSQGDEVSWLIVTAIKENIGYDSQKIYERMLEIQAVGQVYGFSSIYQCDFPTTRLDTIPMHDMVRKFSSVFQKVRPNIVYLPFRGDAHTDHTVVCNALSSCLKWFRYPFVKRVLAYETLSETDIALTPDNHAFHPNVFIDISSFLEKKIEIMKIYKSELELFPFPRSEEAIRSLAYLRGSSSGFKAAESFMLLKEII